MNIKNKQLLTPDELIDLVEMKAQGMGSRLIAKLLGISKSSVNNHYNDWLKHQAAKYQNDCADLTPVNKLLETLRLDAEVNRALYGTDYNPKDVAFNNTKKPRVLFIDIESAPDTAVTFRRFKANMSQEHILQEGGWFLSVAYAFDNEPVQSFCLDSVQAVSCDDASLVATLWDAIEQCDILVAHNLFRFDLALFKARCVINGFPPPKRVKQVDTLKLAKQMKFQSNRLDSLGYVLGEGSKVKHSGIQLWIDCMNGSTEALEEMRVYNVQDVELLRNVYHRLKAFDNNAPNAGLFTSGEEQVCRVCGSTNVVTTNNQIAAGSSLFHELICDDCGARSRLRTSLTTKEKRKSLLA